MFITLSCIYYRSIAAMIMYLTEPGLVLSVKNGHFLIHDRNRSLLREVPVKSVNSVICYTYCQISSGATAELLQEGIQVLYISTHGKLLGKLIAIRDVNVERQRKQLTLSEDPDECLNIVKKIITAKIHNQIIYTRRLLRTDRDKDVEDCITNMLKYRNQISQAESIEEVSGYEGIAARNYFRILSAYLPDSFKINKRTKNPPTDPTNSLLSFAYTLLHSEIYTALEAEGLHPYFGFMHKVRRGHAVLASDLIEEFRSVVADPLVMNFVNYSGVTADDFIHYTGDPGWYLNREMGRKFFAEYEKKLQQKNQYTGVSLSYRQTIASQVHRLAKCIDEESLMDYEPLQMR